MLFWEFVFICPKQPLNKTRLIVHLKYFYPKIHTINYICLHIISLQIETNQKSTVDAITK